MTNPSFLPLAILKELTATENGYYAGFVNLDFLFEMNPKQMMEEQTRLQKLHYYSAGK